MQVTIIYVEVWATSSTILGDMPKCQLAGSSVASKGHWLNPWWMNPN
jgi:hypothetical protein